MMRTGNGGRAVRAATLLAVGLALATFATAAVLQGQSAGGDWPQWRGPDRDGRSADTGLLREWPRSGPPIVWAASDLGAGYGSVAVQGDRVYVQGLRSRQSTVTSLDRATGRVVWSVAIGPGQSNDRGPGPRSTPTVAGDRVYALTENGDLACLRAADGAILWRRNVLREFGARNIGWLVSESPLVDGSRVIVTPGGRNAGMVALDRATGETAWVARELSDEAGYASAIAADVGGVRTILTLTGEAGVGVRASDGRLLWRYRRVANRTANAATPVYADSRVFYTSAYGTGAALLQLTPADGLVTAREIYFTTNMQNHHGGVVLADGYLYGFNNAILTALEFATGKVLWRHRSVGKGSLVHADGHLYIVGEDHVVGLVEATPDGYREKGRFTIRDQGLPAWAHPVVSGGRLYIRDQGVLASYDIRADGAARR